MRISNLTCDLAKFSSRGKTRQLRYLQDDIQETIRLVSSRKGTVWLEESEDSHHTPF